MVPEGCIVMTLILTEIRFTDMVHKVTLKHPYKIRTQDTYMVRKMSMKLH